MYGRWRPSRDGWTRIRTRSGTGPLRASARPRRRNSRCCRAQNTSGQLGKVVQRVPMRVRLDTSDKNRLRCAAGMSVRVDVDTGHAGVPQS